jgi:hypothetical protein
MQSRVLLAVAVLMLAGGTVFVAAEGTGPEKAPQTKEKATEPKEKVQPKEKAAEPKEKAQPKEKAAEPKEKAQPKEKAAEPKEKTDPKAPKTGEKPAAADTGTAKITTEQRTEIRQTIIKQADAPRVTNVDFSVSVGTVVPRTVKVVVLPARVVEIYPQWRGYRYFIVGDRIIIIDDGWRIVFIIEA